ncbi:hypothetical protein [Collimonas silvisoli]|uniref:hypothetical protein n=1 Tax=Collimonas silvisoli TaxID=2825884 RepID=UPI001B8C629A|nr:hypothetical protein [Collimonas silvisoli]
MAFGQPSAIGVVNRVISLSEKSASSQSVNWESEESLKLGMGSIGFYKSNKPPTSTPEAFERGQAVKWEHAALIHEIEAASAKR